MSEGEGSDPRRSRLLSTLAAELARLDHSRTQGWRLCSAMGRVLGADGAAVAVAYDSEDRTVLGASDEVVATLVDLEEVVGQGPGWHSLDRGEVVSCVLDSSVETPWPAYVSAAHERVGPLRVVAVPVSPAEALTGVALLYLRDGELGEPPDVTRFLADAVAVALAGDHAFNPVEPEERWQSRAAVHQATGMVMGQVGVSPEDALALLRAHAYATGTTMDMVARTVTDRTIDFSDYRVEGD